jgi:hypothetical protein
MVYHSVSKRRITSVENPRAVGAADISCQRPPIDPMSFGQEHRIAGLL